MNKVEAVEERVDTVEVIVPPSRPIKKRGKTAEAMAWRKSAFIAALDRGLHIGDACLEVGIARKTFEGYRYQDEDFASEVDQRMERKVDDVEAKLFEGALGERGKDTTIAQIFIMKCRRPQHYTEGQNIKHSGEIGFTLKALVDRVSATDKQLESGKDGT